MPNGAPVTITGTATDTGRQVAGVEVSTDGGATWHPATGHDQLDLHRSVTRHRRRHHPGRGPSTTAATSRRRRQPVSRHGVVPLFDLGPDVTPSTVDAGDTDAVELGVKFTSTSYGLVTGVRFYKAAPNTGTHTGSLWTRAPASCSATATFTGETASGWQQVNFSSPVPILPNTTYIASYYAPNGHYSPTANYFTPVPPFPIAASSFNNGPLHGQVQTPTSANGVYLYSSFSAFPNNPDNATNYWVDVVSRPRDRPDSPPRSPRLRGTRRPP